MSKNRRYNSKEIRYKNVEQRLEHIKNIKPVRDEPRENRDVIDSFFREMHKDKLWEGRDKNG